MAEYEQDSIIRYLIGASRIKYVILDNLFRGITFPNGVVLHVDAHAILYRLYRNKDLDAIYSVDKDVAVKDIVVNFINVLAHYRRYMATRLEATNDIYVYFNTKLPAYQEALVSDYRKKEYEKYSKHNKDYSALTEIVLDAFEFIKGLTPYFTGIYIVENENIDDYSAMYHFMNMELYQNCMHIIFSRNVFPTQLIGPNVIQIYSKRDKSYLITPLTVFSNGILKDRKTTAGDNLVPGMLPFIWTLAGCSDLGVPPSKWSHGIVSTMKLINELADKRMINADMSIQAFLKVVSEHVKDGKFELRTVPTELVNRYRIMSIPLACQALTVDQSEKMKKNCYDLLNQTMLEELNELLAQINSDSDLLEITSLNMDRGVEINPDKYS